SDRNRLILFYECHAADAWPLLGASSYLHTIGQRAFWDDMHQRVITGSPTVEPRVEPVPVRMPLPPAPDTGSIFKTQKSGQAKSAFAA
ncbi:MAG: phytanoyl-CoA dioxygenase family protein, partial [Pseudomonadota bacterium]